MTIQRDARFSNGECRFSNDNYDFPTKFTIFQCSMFPTKFTAFPCSSMELAIIQCNSRDFNVALKFCM